jgi:hypothetical protein
MISKKPYPPASIGTSTQSDSSYLDRRNDSRCSSSGQTDRDDREMIAVSSISSSREVHHDVEAFFARNRDAVRARLVPTATAATPRCQVPAHGGGIGRLHLEAIRSRPSRVAQHAATTCGG